MPDREYFDQPHLDRMFALVVQLLSELDRTASRLAAMELLLVECGVLDPGELDGFGPNTQQREALEARREAMLDRVFRVLGESGPAAAPLRAEWAEALARRTG